MYGSIDARIVCAATVWPFPNVRVRERPNQISRRVQLVFLFLPLALAFLAPCVAGATHNKEKACVFLPCPMTCHARPTSCMTMSKPKTASESPCTRHGTRLLPNQVAVTRSRSLREGRTARWFSPRTMSAVCLSQPPNPRLSLYQGETCHDAPGAADY